MITGSAHARPFDVAFCDTCIGGSTVAAELGRPDRGLRAFFLADYAVNPLGTKSSGEVRAALERWVDIAAERAPVMLVACNTASVLFEASKDLRRRAEQRDLDVISMIDLLDSLLQKDDVRGTRVCLMGTEFTVDRPAYAERLERAGAAEVVRLAATRTERAVARLEHATAEGRATVRREIAKPVAAVDSVVLACTCFPLVGDLIAEINPRALRLDPGYEIRSATHWPGRGGRNRLTLAFTGDAVSAERLAAHAPGLFPGWECADIVNLAD